MKRILYTALNLFICLVTLNGQATWVQKLSLSGAERSRAIGFAIDSFCYIGTGFLTGMNPTNDFWQWNRATNTWTKKANFPSGARFDAISFSIGNKGYVGGGGDYSNWKQDFWEYDPVLDTWNQKANLGGGPRAEGVGFSIGTKGYIVTGGNGVGLQDFWEWDQNTNLWIQKANFPGAQRTFAAGFSIGNKGYVLGGLNQNAIPDFWEWDQATNIWTKKSDFGGGGRLGLIAFSIGTKGYVGTGSGTGGGLNCFQDFWEWDQTTDAWTQIINFGGLPRAGAIGFSVGNRGYIGTGDQYSPYTGYPYEKDFWEFSPSVTTGIKNVEIIADLNIFPNPSSGVLTVTTIQTSTNNKICVYDAIGQCVINKVFTEKSQEIDLAGYSKGIYFLEVISGDKKLVRKILLE